MEGYVQEPSRLRENSMFGDEGIDLSEEDQAVLTAWRELIEGRYFGDIEGLLTYEDEVFGFNVQHAHLASNDTLRNAFHEQPTHCLKLGNTVLKEQFLRAGVHMRGVLRVVGLGDEYRTSIHALRMRNRYKLVSVDVKIVDVSDAYGWLKVAVYRCRDCKDEQILDQRRARERESPPFCMSCIRKARASDNEDELPPSLLARRPNFSLITEDCFYEDAQSLRVRQVVYDDDGQVLNDAAPESLEAVVADEMVGRLTPSTYYRLNAVVKLEPLRDRTFAKDTRRVLSLEVISAEELALFPA
jgi:DNA replicative helicase MCM subunit Mcm2 (Cdc46/Mcm family)